MQLTQLALSVKKLLNVIVRRMDESGPGIEATLKYAVAQADVHLAKARNVAAAPCAPTAAPNRLEIRPIRRE